LVSELPRTLQTSSGAKPASSRVTAGVTNVTHRALKGPRRDAIKVYVEVASNGSNGS